MELAKLIFDSWRNFNGSNDYFPSAAGCPTFQEYYKALFAHYQEPKVANKAFVKKNLESIKAIGSVSFEQQDPVLNKNFWDAAQVFFSEMVGSKGDAWQLPLDFANAMTFFWSPEHESHDDFMYALFLDGKPPVNKAITDRELRQLEMGFMQEMREKYPDFRINRELGYWYLTRGGGSLVCETCGSRKSSPRTCSFCGTDPLETAIRHCPGCGGMLGTMNLIKRGTPDVACRSCKRKLHQEQ